MMRLVLLVLFVLPVATFVFEIRVIGPYLPPAPTSLGSPVELILLQRAGFEALAEEGSFSGVLARVGVIRRVGRPRALLISPKFARQVPAASRGGATRRNSELRYRFDVIALWLNPRRCDRLGPGGLRHTSVKRVGFCLSRRFGGVMCFFGASALPPAIAGICVSDAR